jgi:hypothetical protein
MLRQRWVIVILPRGGRHRRLGPDRRSRGRLRIERWLAPARAASGGGGATPVTNATTTSTSPPPPPRPRAPPARVAAAAPAGARSVHSHRPTRRAASRRSPRRCSRASRSHPSGAAGARALYLPVPLGRRGRLVRAGNRHRNHRFSAPVAIWVLYSRRIASTGGLTAFVEAAGRTGVARSRRRSGPSSYALYLPFTVTDVVYDHLPVVLPGPHRLAHGARAHPARGHHRARPPQGLRGARSAAHLGRCPARLLLALG